MTRHIEMLQDAIDCRLKDVSPNGNVVLVIIVNYKRSQANRANTFPEVVVLYGCYGVDSEFIVFTSVCCYQKLCHIHLIPIIVIYSNISLCTNYLPFVFRVLNKKLL